MAITAYQVTNNAYQGTGVFVYQGSVDVAGGVVPRRLLTLGVGYAFFLCMLLW